MSTLSGYVLADCDLSGNIGSFFGTFPGAVTVGSFLANGDTGCLTSMTFNNCVVLTSLTITSTTPTVPEPSGVSLLGSGVLGLAGGAKAMAGLSSAGSSLRLREEQL